MMAGTAVFSSTAPPPPLAECAEDRPAALRHLGAERRQHQHMSKRYYELAKGPKQIWEVPAPKHVGGISASRGAERRVLGFFGGALLA